jgi:excisionase family DNA binding protein
VRGAGRTDRVVDVSSSVASVARADELLVDTTQCPDMSRGGYRVNGWRWPGPSGPGRAHAAGVRRCAAAAYLGVCLRTIDDLINKGELRAYRLGSKLIRIDLNEADALLVPLESAADRLPVRPSVRKFRGATRRVPGGAMGHAPPAAAPPGATPPAKTGDND